MSRPHASSWYAATVGDAPAFPPLLGDARADVVVVGGGFTGLGCALALAERGVSVILLEAERVGWGASGRNGGQIHTGQRRDALWLEERFGFERAKRLFDLGERAKASLRELVARHQIACEMRDGLIYACHRTRFLAEEATYLAEMAERFDYPHLAWLDRDLLSRALGTDVYHGGWRDAAGGHLHPLKLAQGMARAASQAGAAIHEGTRATRVAVDRVETPNGVVRAEEIVIAANGYMDGLDPTAEARVLPINNYVAVTEPLAEGGDMPVLPGGECASDSRFVVYYWRRTPDGRLLFGGGETYSRQMPDDVASFVRPHLARIYPRLRDVRIDYAWGGTLAVTANRLPYLRRRGATWLACGYSGQGVALAPYAGRMIADAIVGDGTEFGLMDDLPCPPFPGGRMARGPLLALAMSWFALRDRL